MSLNIRKYFLVILIFITGSLSVSILADTRFVASVSSNSVVVGEQIQVTFELQGNGNVLRIVY